MDGATPGRTGALRERGGAGRAHSCLLADPWQAFVSAGDLPSLFSDHVHPNDAGYRLMADAFFEALTRPRGPRP